MTLRKANNGRVLPKVALLLGATHPNGGEKIRHFILLWMYIAVIYK
jgi:hypothetical protein